MKALKGMKAKLEVRINDISLFYTADIKEVTDTHIYFTDKFNKHFVYRIEDIIEIEALK